MKLTLDQIRSVTFGALDVVQAEKGFRFPHFSEAQLEAFARYNPIHGERAHSTTGVRLDFHTDAKNLFVQVCAKGRYEILVNGLSRALFRCKEGTFRQMLTLPGGDNRVTVLLPCHTEGAIDLVMLDEGSYIRPHVYDRKFLFLGDSITQGHAASRDSMDYVSLVSEYFNADYFNWGVGGTTFNAGTLAPLDFDPEAVFVAYGTNDFTQRQSPEQYMSMCRDYLDKVRALWGSKKVFVLSPLWRGDGDVRRPAGTMDECRAMVIEQIEAHGFTHIDGYALCPQCPDFYADGFLHPNDAGFGVYALNLIKALEGRL